MMPICPFCDGEHVPSACGHALAEETWESVEELRLVARDGGLEAVRRLAARRTLEPLLGLSAASEEEIRVLETVNTDTDQRRRLRRSRHVAKAIRHLRQGRVESVAEELDEAETELLKDGWTELVRGYQALLDDRLLDAAERFEGVAERAEDDEGPDALLLAGKARLAGEDPVRARAHFEAVAGDSEGERRAEATYQLARCLLLEDIGASAP